MKIFLCVARVNILVWIHIEMGETWTSILFKGLFVIYVSIGCRFKFHWMDKVMTLFIYMTFFMLFFSLFPWFIHALPWILENSKLSILSIWKHVYNETYYKKCNMKIHYRLCNLKIYYRLCNLMIWQHTSSRGRSFIRVNVASTNWYALSFSNSSFRGNT